MNSFIRNVIMVVFIAQRERERERERERRTDGGLLSLTPHGDRHILSPTSSYFFDGSFDTEPVLIQTDVCTHWLLSGVEKRLYYIFSERPHIFFRAQLTGFISAVSCSSKHSGAISCFETLSKPIYNSHVLR